MHRALGDLDAAEDSYHFATVLDPESAVAHAELGRARYLRGEIAAAKGSFEEAVRLSADPYTKARSRKQLGAQRRVLEFASSKA